MYATKTNTRARARGGHDKSMPAKRPRETGAPAVAAAPSKAEEASLLRALESTEADDRSAACVALAGLFEPRLADDAALSSRKATQLARLCKKGLATKLVQRVVDNDPVVRVHACGALRNAAASGGDEFASELVRADAWNALHRALVDACSNSADECSLAIGIQTLALMDVLCLNIPAVSERQAPSAVPALVSALGVHAFQEAAAKVLCSAVDGNAVMAEALTDSPEALERLSALAQSTLETCAAVNLHALGALLSMYLFASGGASKGLEAAARLFIGTLGKVLSPGELPLARLDDAIVRDALAMEQTDAADATAATESAYVAQWMDRVNVQTLAFEVMGSFVRAGEEDLVGTSEAYSAALHALAASGCLDAAILFATCDFPLTAPQCLSVPVANLQLRAAEAAQALAACPAWAESVSEAAWTAVGAAVSRLHRADVPLGDVFEQRRSAVTALLAALSKSTSGLPFGEADAESLLSLGAAADERAKAMLVSVVAAAGQRTGASARPLLVVAAGDASALVACEAIDGIIDMFSAEERHGLFVQIGALALLQKLFENPRLRRGAQALDEADAMRVEQVLENLAAFIEWKKHA